MEKKAGDVEAVPLRSGIPVHIIQGSRDERCEKALLLSTTFWPAKTLSQDLSTSGEHEKIPIRLDGRHEALSLF